MTQVEKANASNSVEKPQSVEYNVGDWAIVQFPIENKKNGFLQYVAQVVEKEEKRYRVDCLRLKSTRNFSGYIYTTPPIRNEDPFARDNETWVVLSQLKCKLDPPEPYQRALKFNVFVSPSI